MNTPKVYNVLFLCTGNSARSILAESLLNHLGHGRFRAFSAGSHPTGSVQPLVLEVLAAHGLSTSGLRSKPWDEFARAGAPGMDLIVTVCDTARGEICPIWPGRPAAGHWGMTDPAAATGPEEARRRAFEAAFRILEGRIRVLCALPTEALTPDRIGPALVAIADDNKGDRP